MGPRRRRSQGTEASAPRQARPACRARYLKASPPSQPAEPVPLRATRVPASTARRQNMVQDPAAAKRGWRDSCLRELACAGRPRPAAWPRLRSQAPPPPPGPAQRQQAPPRALSHASASRPLSCPLPAWSQGGVSELPLSATAELSAQLELIFLAVPANSALAPSQNLTCWSPGLVQASHLFLSGLATLIKAQRHVGTVRGFMANILVKRTKNTMTVQNNPST